mmetsp:Transcript_38762/g.62573  ORF Transcript_38762/g.62573 Transcript_38762/m.62573 type:complete len:241 (-) Transcript_38762:471-1193(-)
MLPTPRAPAAEKNAEEEHPASCCCCCSSRGFHGWQELPVLFQHERPYTASLLWQGSLLERPNAGNQRLKIKKQNVISLPMSPCASADSDAITAGKGLCSREVVRWLKQCTCCPPWPPHAIELPAPVHEHEKPRDFAPQACSAGSDKAAVLVGKLHKYWASGLLSTTLGLRAHELEPKLRSEKTREVDTCAAECTRRSCGENATLFSNRTLSSELLLSSLGCSPSWKASSSRKVKMRPLAA